MTTHYDDEEQAERLKQWWKENWLSLVAGLVFGLGAIFGWEGYQSHQAGQAASASRMYEDLRLALNESRSEDAASIGQRLIDEHGSSPYAANAALFLAAAAVRANQLDEALRQLRWVRDHGADEGLRDIAALREAQVLWQQGKLDEALAQLDKDNGAFAAASLELKGDILLAQGDRVAARAAYTDALTLGGDDVAAQGELQRKIDDLADVAGTVQS